MCGIAGIYAYHRGASSVDRAELLAVRDHMAARGPDGKGEWYSEDERVGFGHRRLAIIDLSATGAQPMVSADGRCVITYNGEIYNYRALRRELEAKGRLFRTQSDTEVLLQLYAEKGEAMVHELRGMFAFGLWDADRQLLFLARDPYGIKPLYYADDGRTLRFASQVKALLSSDRVSRELEPAGQVGFYLWGSVPEPFTIYSQIRALSAGCTAMVDCGGMHAPSRYKSIAGIYRETEQRARDASRSGHAPGDVRARVRAALLDSVRHHLVADVPVGAFLSAGIDSGALVGLMRDAGQSDIQSVTLAFEEFRGQPDDEAPLASEVARTYGTRHTTRIVTEREFRADLPRIMEAMDQPSIDGINAWFVSKAAHELGLKVAVSGLGGDELFGGYPSFRDIPRWVAGMALPSRIPSLGSLVRKTLFATHLDRVIGGPKAAGMVELGGSYAGAYLLRRGLFMPWELDQVLDHGTVRDGLERLEPLALVESELTPRPKSAFAKVAALESSIYMRNQLLRDTDWASMAHSLEVRVPLVDTTLLEQLAPVARHKVSLAAAPATALPAEVVGRLKTGFGVPTHSWTSSMTSDAIAPRHYVAKGLASRDWSRRVLTGQLG